MSHNIARWRLVVLLSVGDLLSGGMSIVYVEFKIAVWWLFSERIGWLTLAALLNLWIYMKWGQRQRNKKTIVIEN